MFSLFISQDRKNVDQYITMISQGGTTLPDRDYYLKDDPRSTRVRDAYRTYMQTLFSLTGEDAATASRDAEAIASIETTLAKAQYARVDMRDPYKTYNKYAVKDLGTLTSDLNWNNIFSQSKVNAGDSVIVGNPTFLKTADSLLAAVPLNDWKTYLKWNVLKNSAAYLPNAFVEAQFKFSQVLTGQKEQTPRWQRMASLIDNELGELLGQLYVQKYFKPEAKQRMIDLVNNLQTTFEDRIKRLDWMSDSTKQRVLKSCMPLPKRLPIPINGKITRA